MEEEITPGTSSGSNDPEKDSEEIVGELPDDKGDPQEEQYELTGESIGARPIRCPTAPADCDRERHALTHVPFRSWCQYCVLGRSRSTPHRRVANTVVDPAGAHRHRPKWQCDYMFMRLASEAKIVPNITFVEKGGCALARRLRSKSSHDKLARRIVAEFDALGFTQAMVLQGDQENSLKEFMRRVAAMRSAPTILRFSAKGSKGSQGLDEAMHTQIQGLVRTYCTQVRSETQSEIGTDSPTFDAAVSYAAFVLTRFTVRPDGMTPFQAATGQQYSAPLCQFGECVSP